ncbi:MAG: hypothetical protein JO303_13305 [Caulobacteraceae bacterium]|nr:hypothetical protein [Caulobacteraceae bacterium]
MTLIVCPLYEVEAQLARHRPARMISLLSPGQKPPPPPVGLPRLVLRFHDIAEPAPGLIAPDRAMMQALLDFAAAWTEPGPLLAHCWMGISRSTAAAMIIACAVDPVRDEGGIARMLRQASPAATPNPLMAALGDELLGREGRLTAAVAAIGRGQEADCGLPFQFAARPGRQPWAGAET